MRFSLTSGVSAGGGTLVAEVILALATKTTAATKTISTTTEMQATSTKMIVSSEPSVVADESDNSLPCN